MKEKEEEEKTSIFEKIATALKLVCVIIILLIIAVLALQRFSNNKIAVGGFRIFNVATGSMLPVYEVGDVLLVKKVDTDTLKVGDNVTYLGEKDSFANRVVTHQIIKIEEQEGKKIFHTKGTANNTEDPTITGDRIYGKVIYKMKLISMLTKLMNNGKALYIVIFIPISIIIFLQIKANIDEKHSNKENDDDEDDDE